MNPYWLLATVLAQIACFSSRSHSWQALSWALALAAAFAFFARTRRRWSAHLDMHLIMAGPGSLAMLVPQLVSGELCPLHANAAHLAWMSVSMLACTIPITWKYARCVQQARLEGRAIKLLSLDALGMQLGMLAVHILLASLNPLTAARLQLNPNGPWLIHGMMLAGMSLGMFALTDRRANIPRVANPLP